MSELVLKFKYHHFCPKVENFSVKVNNKTAIIELPKYLRVQGVSPFSDDALIRTNAQGGFLMQPVVLVKPKFGLLQKTAVGWVYTKNDASSSSKDGFIYALVYFGQRSIEGFVTIT